MKQTLKVFELLILKMQRLERINKLNPVNRCDQPSGDCTWHNLHQNTALSWKVPAREAQIRSIFKPCRGGFGGRGPAQMESASKRTTTLLKFQSPWGRVWGRGGNLLSWRVPARETQLCSIFKPTVGRVWGGRRGPAQLESVPFSRIQFCLILPPAPYRGRVWKRGEGGGLFKIQKN